MTFTRTRCPHCKGKLDQGQRIHKECIDAYADAQAAKAARAADKQARMQAKADRAETRRRKEAGKTLNDLHREAQKEFNAFIRHRDRHQPCISCSTPLQGEAIGGGYDAGHYLSRGAAPHLRYDERNVHGQCKQCNRYASGNAAAYRAGIIERIGLDQVEDLEANRAKVRKWQHDELRAIRDQYRAANKASKKE